MKSPQVFPQTSPFQKDPEFQLYFHGFTLLYSTRISALLLWVTLGLVATGKAFLAGHADFAHFDTLSSVILGLKVFAVLLMVWMGGWFAHNLRLRRFQVRIDQHMKEDMLYTRKNSSFRSFARSHIAQLLGRLGTYTFLHLICIELSRYFLS